MGSSSLWASCERKSRIVVLCTDKISMLVFGNGNAIEIAKNGLVLIGTSVTFCSGRTLALYRGMNRVSSHAATYRRRRASK